MVLSNADYIDLVSLLLSIGKTEAMRFVGSICNDDNDYVQSNTVLPNANIFDKDDAGNNDEGQRIGRRLWFLQR